MPCTTACSVYIMSYDGRICTTKALLYAFVGLCIVMFASVFSYWHRVNEIFSLSVQLTDNVNELYTDDAKALLRVLKLTDFSNGEMTLDFEILSTNLSDKMEKNKTKLQKARPESCKSCFNHNFNYILDNDQICHRNKTSPEIDIVMLIFTVHKNRLQRDTIRKTWITYAKQNSLDSNIRYAFLLGATDKEEMEERVRKESIVFRDIIKEDFKDAYSNLTYKTMMAFKWASTKCKHAKFVMKTDDDMYVNIPNILTTLKTNKDKLQTHVGGFCHETSEPVRNPKSKWYASNESFPGNHYPGFCSGTGYVTSMNVATKVFEMSKHVPFFHLEDVYVSLCIKKLGYGVLTIPGFNSETVPVNPCVYHGSSMMTSHQVPPKMMRRMWFAKCKNRD